MFKQLRNRFLIVNLVTISITMLAAFAAIYVITYQDVANGIRTDRERIMELYQVPRGGDRPYGENAADGETPAGATGGGSAAGDTQGSAAGSGAAAEGGGFAGGAPGGGKAGGMHQGGGRGGLNSPPPERFVSFMLLTDNDWNISVKDSQMTMDDSLYTEALGKAKALGTNTGEFTMDGSRWTFEKKQTSLGYMLVFLDITAQRDILTRMIYTFSAVGIVMLVILFFFSRYFANRSIKPVREAFEKQKQFIADASHELKTPLAVINTNADVLLANREDTIGAQAKWLQYIKSETGRMAKLTSDLLYLTEMDDSRIGPLHAPFDMSDAAMDIILTMEAVIFEQNVMLDYDIAPDVTVNGNREQIKQVVMILLDNAVKYSGPGGQVNLTLKKQQGEALLAVSNTGDGIAPEHLHRIFDRFYRTDTSRSRKQGGHGLGLAIAKSIIEQQHKGKIYAKSQPGGLTTFYVQLP
ncbi:cell wall metabolism sensor histidine kinase WalK [Paenibacillus sp. NFR01]|uniref:sensor histidine kinase n=1 Tax=Paenibacillus sp. NFR01 TaxID=1566279 RepID=UPI0008D856EB|nr:HAMP domain-containing sensor histidine kinase [Paenibacillus sp. NFR01]SET94549.1 His Kinase A (phospho-acceptor) domain-containing protein [Paenibacillus sp. NFR01]